MMISHRFRGLVATPIAGLTLLSCLGFGSGHADAQGWSGGPVRGICVNAPTAGNSDRFAPILDLIKRTELNAVVVDIKDDTGHITFDVDNPTARAAGAVRPVINEITTFTDMLRAKGIYSIARIVVFKDYPMVASRPDWAVTSTTGGVWRDYNGGTWLDPYNEEAWVYLIDIALSAAKAGFDEIQFDYVRFVTDGNYETVIYPSQDKRTKDQVIADFLARARQQIHPTGAKVSVDVFGLITSVNNGMGIGQRLENVAPQVDLVSPMIYPSHYSAGNLGLANPNTEPYETVVRSLRDAKRRLEDAGLTDQVSIRPWLQDFSWGYPYGPAEVRAQIQATYDAGYTEWLLWNSALRYTEGALNPPPPQADPTPPEDSTMLPPGEVGPAATISLNQRRLTNPYADVEPFVANSTGRTLIPIRYVAEALWADVAWDQASQEVTIQRGEDLVKIGLGQTQATINSRTITLDQAPVLWQSRTLIPLRFLAEAFGAEVSWDESTNHVSLSLPGTTCRPGYCLD